MTKLLAAALLSLFVAVPWCAAPRSLGAQTSEILSMEPGDGAIDGSRIRPYTNVWNVYRVHADGREDTVSTWWDTVTVGREGGRTVLRRVQHVRRARGGVRYLLNVVDAQTLQPLRSVDLLDADTVFALDFDGARIHGVRRFVPHGAGPANAVRARVDIRLPRPVFDWQLWGVLVAGLPLRDGFAGSLLAHVDSPVAEGPLIRLTAKVVGSERVAGARGPVDTWMVDVQAEVPWRLWIAKDPAVAPVVQIRIPTPDPTVANWWRSELEPTVPR